MYERSYQLTCIECGWYVIVRNNGSMLSRALNNFTVCPKCKSTQFKTTIPSLIKTINPLEQFKKFYYLYKCKNM